VARIPTASSGQSICICLILRIIKCVYTAIPNALDRACVVLATRDLSALGLSSNAFSAHLEGVDDAMKIAHVSLNIMGKHIYEKISRSIKRSQDYIHWS